jgi:hypothetical protein
MTKLLSLVLLAAACSAGPTEKRQLDGLAGLSGLAGMMTNPGKFMGDPAASKQSKLHIS